MLKSLALAGALLCALFMSSAEARQHRHAGLDASCNQSGPNMPTCVAPYTSTRLEALETRGKYIARQVGWGGPAVHVRRHQVAAKPLSYGVPSPSVSYTVRQAANQVIGGRPAGCPHAFCGCGASLHLFGRIIPSLNLAANWLRFPRAAPAPRMAAARYGHVMVLEEHISGDVWLVHDSNSGHGLTRLHARSIAGYTIVDPRGAG